MERKDFLKALAILPFMTNSMKLNALNKLDEAFSKTKKMPALFLGHGSPMNAIEENEFVQSFKKLGKDLPTPNAILCISAHWETNGTFVTGMKNPKTIHDFGGFPKALFEVEYPAPGSPELAAETQKLITSTHIGIDHTWGLDHGAWSVIKHLYPKANIPVVQLSIDYTKDGQYHYDLAKQISKLREKGILIIGSGNLVHNLRMIAWDKLNNNESYGYDWAIEASETMKKHILSGDFKSLIDFRKQGSAFQLAIPTPEHYLPLLYTLGIKNTTDQIELFNDKAIGGSLTMTSLKIY